VLLGRPFQGNDGEGAGCVTIIKETFAKKYFLDANPIGHHLAFADCPFTLREIVGVVSDFRQRNPEEDIRPLAYFPILQTVPPRWSMAIRVRTASDLRAVSAQIPNWLESVTNSLSPINAETVHVEFRPKAEFR
jgi:hypothetical protein